MMRRRPVVVRQRPGLVGTVARTAVIAGTASATAGAVANRQQGKAQAQAAEVQDQQDVAAMQQQMADMQARQTAAAVPPPVAAPATNPMMEQLQQLGRMKEQGLLTDDEFAAAKARLLAG